MALSRIKNQFFANNNLTKIESSSANTISITTSNIARVTIANTGNTLFANSVTINGGVSAYLAQDNYPLFVTQSAGLPNGSTQANAAVQIGDVNSARRIGFGTYSDGSWIQSSYPGQAGPAYPISLNPNGGAIGVATSSPRGTFEVNGADSWFNGVQRTTGVFDIGVSVRRRIQVVLGNYAYASFKLYARRTNGGNCLCVWEGGLNNNNNQSFSTAFATLSGQSTLSFTLASPASGIWNFDYNVSESGAGGWYVMESSGYNYVSVTTY